MDILNTYNTGKNIDADLDTSAKLRRDYPSRRKKNSLHSLRDNYEENHNY